LTVLSLQPTTDADRDAVRAWRNQPDVARWMYTDHEITEAEHAAWFARHLASPTDRSWVIRWQGRGVGLVNLSGIDTANGRAEWGIYLADAAARGTGAADGATFLSLDHAFGPLHLQRVTCEAIADNHRAIRLYERMGFRREGHRRAHVVRGDERLDVVDLGLLADEWGRLRPGHHDRLVSRGVLGEDVAMTEDAT
jgi:UDP-4-amino-4,6-dideoxy-N-acetyl-beta-L-altrosamine N-acetyltransferase